MENMAAVDTAIPATYAPPFPPSILVFLASTAFAVLPNCREVSRGQHGIGVGPAISALALGVRWPVCDEMYSLEV